MVEFNVVLNTFEFVTYTLAYKSIFGLKKIIAMRIAAVGLHTLTSIVHWLTEHSEKLGFKNKDKDEISTIGSIIATLIHSLWNTVAVVTATV